MAFIEERIAVFREVRGELRERDARGRHRVEQPPWDRQRDRQALEPARTIGQDAEHPLGVVADVDVHERPALRVGFSREERTVRGGKRVGESVQPGADVVIGRVVVERDEQRDAAGAVEHEDRIEAVRVQRGARKAGSFAQVGVGRGAGGFEEDAGHATTVGHAGRREPRMKLDGVQFIEAPGEDRRFQRQRFRMPVGLCT